MAGEYVKCPRCDLNYMKKGEEYCDICKAELKKGPKLVFAIDDEDEMENEALDLCPRCHQNYIKPGQSMCDNCAKELERAEAHADEGDDDSWKDYLDEEIDETEEDNEEMLSLNKLAEEENDELFDDEEDEEVYENEEADEDDFFIPEIKDTDFEDDEFEDDEFEEEDEDEDF